MFFGVAQCLYDKDKDMTPDASWVVMLPWKVVDIVMSFMPDAMSIPKNFVRKMRHCMPPDRYELPPHQKPFMCYSNYEPPHLLVLLRYYIVGEPSNKDDTKRSTPRNWRITTSISAIKLAEIGMNQSQSSQDSQAHSHVPHQRGGNPLR
nr:unnamed protein product [Digitaria exilis]